MRSERGEKIWELMGDAFVEWASAEIISLRARVKLQDALIEEALEFFDTIAIEPVDPNDGINHGKHNMVLARRAAAMIREKVLF